jgi:hypothetical protein
MKTFTKQYQLWISNGNYGYTFTEHDTIIEAILAEKYTSDWYITKNVAVEIKESTPQE